jgi:hypothetical protein
MRGVWPKTRPLPSERTVQAAKPLRLVDAYLSDRTHILQALRAASREDAGRRKTFRKSKPPWKGMGQHCGKGMLETPESISADLY